MKKSVCFFALLSALFFSFTAGAEAAGEAQKARVMGQRLVELFTPESISVTISDGGGFAWVEAKGAVIDKIRVEDLKLRAMIKNDGEKFDMNDKDALAKQILMSRGELTLLEKDVNKLFSGDIETKGFSNLVFDFKPDGFTANGVFTAQFLFTIKIRLRAHGNLALQPDGVYIENVKIYTEGVPTPDGLVKMVTDRINPLLSFSKIPFPTEFKTVIMNDSAAVLTGNPEKFEGGKTWRWNKKQEAVKTSAPLSAAG